MKRAQIAATLLALAFVIATLWQYRALPLEHDLVTESTLGRLSLWLADQSANDADEILSPLAQLAKQRADHLGAEALDVRHLYEITSSLRALTFGAIALLLILALLAIARMPVNAVKPLLLALLMLDALLFFIPTVAGSPVLPLLLLSILSTVAALALSPGKISRVMGFVLALSALMLLWEASKSFAHSVNYKIVIPQPAWTYATYANLDEALEALEAGAVDIVVEDRRDLDDLMPPHPPDDKAETALPWQNLRYLAKLERADGVAFLPILPAFPGRLTAAVRAADADTVTSARDIFNGKLGAVAGEFADAKFFKSPRNLVLLDLKILNDLNLPHLQMIAEAFLQPARRNGEFLLLRILTDAGFYTFSEAIFGFLFGAVLGFALGALFAHSKLMERGLLPYVVASQTVPILAIAPMVVIWLGASQLSVAVIAAYLTFFPVTINTLRGLTSPAPAQIELMRSYAASRWTIMRKLRLPAALPYIFTALKVSATASVVGAIIGELPSGIGDGLGRAILDFSSDYSMISTPKLWASIVTAAAVGIVFFASVSLAERVALRRHIRPAN